MKDFSISMKDIIPEWARVNPKVEPYIDAVAQVKWMFDIRIEELKSLVEQNKEDLEDLKELGGYSWEIMVQENTLEMARRALDEAVKNRDSLAKLQEDLKGITNEEGF